MIPWERKSYSIRAIPYIYCFLWCLFVHTYIFSQLHFWFHFHKMHSALIRSHTHTNIHSLLAFHQASDVDWLQKIYVICAMIDSSGKYYSLCSLCLIAFICLFYCVFHQQLKFSFSSSHLLAHSIFSPSLHPPSLINVMSVCICGNASNSSFATQRNVWDDVK